ncbi:hypothetical protein GPECTOR_83g293 [Gonium pectorale]|uniref:Uncharacterized protein n=1 Tax=Gonium pectorale TaxID=33097 RepID=A0A150G1J4_GONPE|nr:hypothetical protein GPECTOR_83g293 [Gonium pectorale]|eukprot:KXZ43681.1 hypothetical protein GPECTOR_83g293 [Gonium pectorale]
MYDADEQSRATGRREQLYVLTKPQTVEGDRLSRSGTSSGYGAEADVLASLIGGLNLRGRGGSGAASSKGKATVSFHPEAVLKGGQQGGPVARALNDAACTAARNMPAFDVLKIRLNLGKQYFFNLEGLEHRAEVALADIQGLDSGSGRDKKSQSVFSNCVPAATVPRVSDWLTTRMGFVLVDSKASATVHVIDQTLNVHYAVALTLPEG